MPSLNLDLSYFDHQKAMRIEAKLGNGSDVLPIRLWAYVGRQSPENGRLAMLEIEIERVCRWWGEKGAMVAAMVEIGFIERDGDFYQIHDWLDHSGHLSAFKKRAVKANKIRWSNKNKTRTPTRTPKHKPKESPSSAVPCRAVPCLTSSANNVNTPVDRGPADPMAAQALEVPKTSFGPEDVMALWNDMAHPNLQKVSMLNKGRLGHLKTRLTDFPARESWVSIFKKVNASEFLTGLKRGVTWKATFDWVLLPTNLTKIMEGNYDDKLANAGR